LRIMLERVVFNETNAYKYLSDHYIDIAPKHLRQLFDSDPERFEKFSIVFEDILFDYSKNRIDDHTIALLIQLARECEVEEAIHSMFSGEAINETENRAVLHTALRSQEETPLVVDGENIRPRIKEVLKQMEIFCDKVISGNWKGYTGKEITDVVNIGIGGSDLVPVMVTEALKAYKTRLNVHFVSNVDGTQISETLKKLDPETTLFLIASKTFTTQETMANAFSAKDWLLKKGGREDDVSKHFVALSTNTSAVESFGIDPKNMFVFWEWVGGRYSLWSAIGLSIALAIGFDNFDKHLKGANAADLHFRESEFESNIPV